MPKPSEILGQFVYRGVHSGHPRIKDAKNGIVYPGNLKGIVTPTEHNEEMERSKDSPYTSWTTRIDVARIHAYNYGRGGVVLRTKVERSGEFVAGQPFASAASWPWVDSPDIFGEDEILLWGVMMDLEVIEP